MADFTKDSEIEADCGSVEVEISTSSMDDVAVPIGSCEQQQVKRMTADDGSELVAMTAKQYDEFVRRLQLADGLYEQLDDEKRRRIEIDDRYRSSAETVVRLNSLVTRYRQMLISNQLQLEQPDDASNVTTGVGAELTEAFFKRGAEEFELTGRRLAESVETTASDEDWAEEKAEKNVYQQHSALEADDADVAAILAQVSDDARLQSSHEQLKSSAPTTTTTGDDSLRRVDRKAIPRQHEELVNEAARAIQSSVPTRSSTSDAAAVSHDLLQKVIEHNARLKHLLRKIVDTKGMTIREFLERSDYAELVEKLQSEVTALRSQVRDQQQQLRADDSTLTAKCAALTDQVHKLKQSSTVKQALIDVYGAECSRLQSELKRLSSGDVISSKGNSQPQQQQPVLGSRDQPVSIQKLSQDVIQLKQKYSDAEKVYRRRVNELESSLRQETQRVQQLESENKTLNSKLQGIVSQIYSAATQETSERKPEVKTKLSASCGQSEHVDRPWMTPLPQTGLMVDSDEQLQQHGGDANVDEDSKPQDTRQPVTETGAVAADQVFVCPRCDGEFDDEARFEKHCKKCSDD